VDDVGITKTWTYSYDSENRLIKVGKQESGETKTITLKYDPFGRRIEKKVEGIEAGFAETKTYVYVYDNEDIIAEYLTKTENGISRTEATKYVHGPGIDEAIAIEQKGETYYYHADGLGSIAALTDARQKVMESYTYTSFGDIKGHGDKVKNTYTFTGREWDDEVDLYFYRARYYDAQIGRFLTNDPILSGIPLISRNRGRSNSSDKRNPLVQTKLLHPYIYAVNDPINKTDPSGLAPCNQCCDCPSGTWLIDQGGTASFSLIFGVSKTRIEFRCSGNNKKCSGVLNCGSIGLQAEASFQWNIDFYTIGTGSIVRNACNFSDIINYASSGWTISVGLFSTGGGEVGIGAGPGFGAGVAYQWCTAGDMVCQ
jgi:RHS repeat-associated protein